MLHCNETWAVTTDDLRSLERNEASVLSWICLVSVDIQEILNVLREKLGESGHQL